MFVLQVVNWDEQLEGNEDAQSDDEDLDQGESFDYRVNNLPAFAGLGADMLRLPHGLKVVRCCCVMRAAERNRILVASIV